MKTIFRAALYLSLSLLAASRVASAQGSGPAVNPAARPSVLLRGLRSTANHGSFKAARYAPDGSLLLLFDGGDGITLLRTDAAGSRVLGEVHEGSAGDTGIAMAVDAAGNIYVAGTTLSGTLQGTTGSVYPAVQDGSTNSFLAKFNTALQLQFLTFLGEGKTAASGVAVTADAVFVAGTTFADSFPTTTGSVLPQLAPGTQANGFVECFSPDGSHLLYSTLLTAAGGDSEVTAIAADAADHLYVVGETSAASFPSIAALVPVMPGPVAGFVLKLNPAGDAFAFASFVPGAGLTGVDLDPSESAVFVCGDVDIGQFPIANVPGPIADLPYQALLRFSTDGSELLASMLLAPGTSSAVTATPDGGAWVAGVGTVPVADIAGFGDGFYAHVNAKGLLDASGRTGGMAVRNASFATLASTVGAPAVDAAGTIVALPGTLEATVNASPSLPAFDLPLHGAPSTLLPELPLALLPPSCTGTSQCVASAGLLTLLGTTGSQPGISLSSGSFPLLTLRNEGLADVSGLSLSSSSFGLLTDCTGELQAGSVCGVSLSGSSPGTLIVTSAQQASAALTLPGVSTDPQPLLLSASALDFGIVTGSSPGSRTVSVTNVGATAQSFSSGGDGLASAPPFSLSETASTCSGTASSHAIPANSSCTLVLSLAAHPLATDDGPVRTAWQVAGQDLAVTGITAAADLSLSSAQVDFGTTFAGSSIASLPRYLFLSNSSASSMAHAAVPSPATGPFQVLDECPSTLEPASVCRLTITYTPVIAPSVDSLTLLLDGGLNALITGEYWPGTGAASPPVPSLISAEPGLVTFSEPVTETGISAVTQAVTITNASAEPVPLSIATEGDFSVSDPCGPTLQAHGSCTLAVAFAPSQPGVRRGLLSVGTGSESQVLNVALTGTGTSLLPPNNGVLALGASPVGEPSFGWYKVKGAFATLSASTSAVAFRVAIVEDDGNGHGILPASAFAPEVTHSCRNCWLGVVMVAPSTGAQTGGLLLSTVAGGHPYVLSLTGSGTPLQGLIASPSTADLGTVPVASTSATLVVTVSNLLSPNTEVKILGISSSGDFQVREASQSLPCAGTLDPGASCQLAITFTPTATGERTGSLTLETTGGSLVIPLTGSAVVNPGLILNPNALVFNESPGASSVENIQLTNTAGVPLTLSPVRSTDPRFTPASQCGVLQPGSTCTIAVTFVVSASEASGSLKFYAVPGPGTDAAPIPFSIPLTALYTSADTELTLLPAVADFGAQTSGTLGSVREFTIINNSSLAQAIAISPPQSFPLATPSACGTLEPGGRCTFSLAFVPEAGGTLTGSIFVAGTPPSGSPSQAIGYLLGYGNAGGQMTITGDTLLNGAVDFGQVPSGTTAQHTLTLTNGGLGPLNIRRVAAGPPFRATTTCAAALAPGEGCKVTLMYAPLYGAGSQSSSMLPRADAETLTIASDARSSPDQVQLLGSTVAASNDGGATSSTLASYTLSTGALTFANTAIGTTSPLQTITVQNTGTATLTFAPVAAPLDYTASSTCGQLPPGASCQLTIAFQPQPQLQPQPGTGGGAGTAVRAATLALQSNALDALEYVSLLGLSIPTPLGLSDASLNFPALPIGNTESLQLSVTNLSTLPISLGEISAAGDFSVQPGTCPKSGGVLAGGEVCTLLVEFGPSATGTRSGVLSLPSDALPVPLTVALNGTGTAPRLAVSPASLDFGDEKLGASAELAVSLLNSGTAPLIGMAASLSGPAAADFAITAPCASATLALDVSCGVLVTFSPKAIGPRSAVLTLRSNDPSGPITVPLSGTGTFPAGLDVTVNAEHMAALSVTQGSTVRFQFAVAPLGGFVGPVTLTCSSNSPGPYAACNLLVASMTLNGAAGTSTGSITTLGPVRRGSFALGGFLCALPILLGWRRKGGQLRRNTVFVALSLSLMLGAASGCGGPGSTGDSLTPRGTYLYEVTATAPGAAPDAAPLRASALISLTVQ